jgi:hypothetical protein
MAEVLASGKNAGERYLTSLEPQMKKMELAQKDLGEFQAVQSESEARRKAEQTRSKAEAARQEAETVRTSPVSQDLGKVESQLMDTSFIPTQDNAKDLAGLFSLISVVGMALGRGGKGDAMQAMSAMNGMLEGYQKGRSDLYKKEKDTFESTIKSLKTKSEILTRRLTEISKLASRDAHAADLEADALFAEQGANFLRDYKQKFGLAATVEFQKQQLKAAEKAAQLTETEIQKNREIAAADKRAQMRVTVGKKQLMQGSNGKMYSFNPETNEFSPVALPAGVESVAKPGARAGQNALTFASRVYGNIENSAQDLKNIISLPATAQLPVLSGLLNVEKDTALKSIESMAARKITSPENRAFQQVSDQLGAALSRMEAQGLASGATKANVASFNSLRPAAGDNAVNMAIYLARVKQEIETGIKVLDKMPGATTEQKEAVKVILQDLNTFVPYNVQDALDVLKKNNKQLGDKMTRLVSQPTVANNLNIGLTQQPTQEKPSVDFEKERSSAKSAIASGKDESAVKARFKERTGQEL